MKFSSSTSKRNARLCRYKHQLTCKSNVEFIQISADPIVRKEVNAQTTPKLDALDIPNHPADKKTIADMHATWSVCGLLPSTKKVLAIIGPVRHPIPIQL